ncbi:hypothetical protein HDV02_003397 [Globomyces sp. JEL0801]|nr:hypothetical protein HDV02_003397 [Globomyces sp. JEL0801]
MTYSSQGVDSIDMICNGVVVAAYVVPITNGTLVFVNLGAQGFSNIDKLTIIGDGGGFSWILIDDLSTTLTNP